MLVCAMSDLHGNLSMEIPSCDVILLAGDICPCVNPNKQLKWLKTDFKNWLEELKYPVIACAGNHDWPMFNWPIDVKNIGLKWTYLQDDFVEFQGFKIYGSPWQKRFYDWAFNLDEPQLAGKWNLIPDDTDILICHSPPKFICDFTQHGESVGSETLMFRTQQLQKLKLMVFGHIHPGRGVLIKGQTTFANVSLLDDYYQMVNKPFLHNIVKEKND